MIKAAFFDLDGTLFSHKTNTVPASAIRAVQELRRRGILVFLATGRHISLLEGLPQLQDLTYDGAITLNGQYCYDRSGVIYDNPIRRESICALLAHLERAPMPCAFIEEQQMYINFHNDRVRLVHGAIHSPLPELGDLRRGYDHPVYQVLLYLTDEELTQLPELPHTGITKWHNGGVDVIPAGGGKAVGIGRVLAHYGISKAETIAFGDGDNDIDMFGAVGTAVAMGNAGEKVRRAAHYVTKDVDDDGILHALTALSIL